ncbi:hypothetical protein K1719_030006 [Acacia pycnantha]|nr:hypothetical protein K1719_030006 [Acacia pycnantha]
MLEPLKKEGKNQNQNKKDLYGVCNLGVLDSSKYFLLLLFSFIASCLSTKVKKRICVLMSWFENRFYFSLVSM